ncbi:hypothetical protein G9A89_014929 [Geosiphon pyriformis]|nr:hypothetical protein G9A89_014929 [Geosiphon pyriformis]
MEKKIAQTTVKFALDQSLVENEAQAVLNNSKLDYLKKKAGILLQSQVKKRMVLDNNEGDHDAEYESLCRKPKVIAEEKSKGQDKLGTSTAKNKHTANDDIFDDCEDLANSEDDNVSDSLDVDKDSEVENKDNLGPKATAQHIKSYQINLRSMLADYCKKKTISSYNPARSFILDLSPSSKIRSEFPREKWNELVASKCITQWIYHHEIESIIAHLFGGASEKRPFRNLSEARSKWYTLRDLPSSEYTNEFSYAEDDWRKICRWIERATGQFLDVFKSSCNLLQNNCQKREWFGDYIVPLFQGALKLDGNCRVPW